MAMASSTTPRLRVHLFVLKRAGEWVVWELLDLVVPASQQELPMDRGPDSSRPESASREKRDRAREPTCVVSMVEVNPNGTVEQAWPPCECVPDEV